MKACHIGSKCELEAQVWFLNKGYEVFANISACGPVDMIILNPNTKELTFIDIKSQKIFNKRWRKVHLKPRQESLGVKLCYRLPDGTFSFSLPEIDDYWMKFNSTSKKKPYKKKPKKVAEKKVLPVKEIPVEKKIIPKVIVKQGKFVDCPQHLLETTGMI